jgi:hypothetical protein
MSFHPVHPPTEHSLIDPIRMAQEPVSPYLDNETIKSSQSVEDRTLLPTSCEEKSTGEHVSHSVYRVDSDDTLTQAATQRRKLFSQLRNPTDPTQYNIPAEYRTVEKGEASTIREYRRSRQRIRILLNSVLRLLITALLCGMCAFVLRTYQKKGDLKISDAQWFNTLMTALPLFIGLNYRSSLQSYARVLRWWILARWDWKLRQFDLILDAASSKAILKLLWYSGRCVRSCIPTMTQFACLAWLAINLTGAIGIALLSLTYQMEQSQGVLMRNGDVSILDVSNESLWAESAHYYGSSGAPVLLFTWAILNARASWPGLSGSGNTTGRPSICRTCTTWNYNFQDWDPSSDVKGLSERTISASASCKGYSILNYTSTSVIYQDAQNTTQSFDIPWVGRPWSTKNPIWYPGLGANYIYDSKSDCGPRCARMYIISTQVFVKSPSWFYNCTNTVASIEGNSPYAPLSDASARSLAAASAAYRNATDGEWATNKAYDWSNPWTLYALNKQYINDEIYAASSLAQFSLVSLANADHVEGTAAWLPPEIPAREAIRKIVRGSKPYQALRLGVNWAYAIAIMCAVPGLQLIVLLTIVFFANDVVVKDESHLNTARLLFPVAQKMSHRGSLLQVEEVVGRFGHESARYRYGWEYVGGMLRVGVLERLAGVVMGRNERKFPEGQYD